MHLAGSNRHEREYGLTRSRTDWMRHAVAGTAFLGIGLGVMLIGLVTYTGDLLTLGAALVVTQAVFLVGLLMIRRFAGLR